MVRSKFKISLLIVTLTCNVAFAIYPSGKVKIHNAKLQSLSHEKLDRQWFDYIDEYPEILIPENKKYKIDQYCRYSMELDADGKIILDSIGLLKHRQNFQYNLKAIQFLRENPLVLKRKNLNKPVELELIYESF